MLRVTIELIPGGIESHPRRQVIHVAEISNIGGTHAFGDYQAEFYRRGVVHPTRANTPVNGCKIVGFPRLRKNAWHLLAQALKKAGYE